MPKFTFILSDGKAATPGFTLELPDLASARHEAVRALAELARDELPNDGDQLQLWVSIEDGSGRELLRASLGFEVQR